MTKIFLIALLAAVSGCIAVHAPPPEPVAVQTVAASEVASLDLSMPAPQEPCDNTVITAAETLGAASEQ